ncbi:MAG: AAA family ATPase [Phycisphaeraceae bacterium]
MTRLTTYPTRIPPPAEGRPRRLALMFQSADHPVIARVFELLRHEDYSQNLLISGPSGCGKDTLACLIAARRCCPDAATDAVDACGYCELCSRIFSGRGVPDSAFYKVSAANEDWWDRLSEIAQTVNSITNVHLGNPRPLPPVFTVDEVHVLGKANQTRLANLIEGHPACFVLTTSEPEALIVPLVTRCEQLDIGQLSEQAFCRGFGRLLAAHHIDFDSSVPRLFHLAAGGSVREAIQKASTLSASGKSYWDEALVRGHLNLGKRHRPPIL